MNSDKIFHISWGLLVILAGLSIIFGIYLRYGAIEILMLLILDVGIILIIIGGITKSKEKNNATIQIILGLMLVILSLGGLSVILNILDAIIALAIIIVIFGISIVILGLIKHR